MRLPRSSPAAARLTRSYAPALTFGLFLALYTVTLSPGLLPADAGEFQLTGAVLGVAHPPGFALYTLLSWLISRAPLVGAATAINWLSALLAAATLALVYRVIVTLTRSPLAGLAGALLLGLSTTFWAQAVTANIRMPAAFTTALALDRLLAYRAALSAASPSPRALTSSLSLFSIALGLAVSHHGSLVFVAAVLGLYALSLRPTVLRRPWPLLAGLLPFLAWLYFPLRAGAVGAPPAINTLAGFLEHILARGFSGDILFFATPAALPDRLAVFGNILTFEFVWPALALIALGALAAFAPERRFGGAVLLAVAVHTFVAITYRAPQTVEYLLPVWVLMGVWAGLGLDLVRAGVSNLGLASRAPQWVDAVLPAALAALAALAQCQVTFPSYWALARDHTTRAYAEGVLRQAPPDAAVLAAWHWATPLWYLQQVEGLRPDVDVRYVVPQGESLAQNWADAIGAALPVRPVILTSYFASEYASLPARFVPLGSTPAWQALASPLMAPPPGLTGARTFGDWEFLGYRLDESGPAQVTLTAAWRTPAVPTDISVFVHLLDPQGALHSQRDIAYPAASYRSGEVLLNRFTLPLRPDAPAGPYTLVAGVYRSDGARLAEAALPAVEVPPQPFAGLRLPEGAIPLGNELWLESSRVSPAGPVQPGEVVRVTLNFLSARPLTADYTVKVDLIGPGYAWQVGSNGTPAGGAIPTLKWIAGSRVTDVHALVVPLGASPGPAQIALAVYDAFTQAVLPILDPVLAQQGPTVPLGVIEVAR